MIISVKNVYNRQQVCAKWSQSTDFARLTAFWTGNLSNTYYTGSAKMHPYLTFKANVMETRNFACGLVFTKFFFNWFWVDNAIIVTLRPNFQKMMSFFDDVTDGSKFLKVCSLTVGNFAALLQLASFVKTRSVWFLAVLHYINNHKWYGK